MINYPALCSGRTTLCTSITLAALSITPQVYGKTGFSEEVIVTASRTEKPLGTIPNTVTVINADELAKQITISHDISTILGNMVPSFSPARQKLSSAGESLRGRKPLYLIDGVPQSNPLREGGRDGHTIDPIMIERVEVIHGANAIHGLGAAGGIINLITKKPTQETVHSLRIGIEAQDADVSESLGYNASYTLSGSVDRFDAIASFGYRETGVGYDANDEVIGFDNTQGDTMDSASYDAFLKLGYNLDQQRIELTYNHYRIENHNDWLGVNGNLAAGIPTTAIKADVPGDAPQNEVTTISLNYLHEALFGHQLRVQLFSQDFAGTYGGGTFGTFQDPAFGANVFDQSENQSQKYGMKLTLSKDRVFDLPVNAVYGVDVVEDKTQQELIQTGRAWVPETVYKNYAPFLQLEYVGIEKLTVSAGVRQEESELEVEDFTTLYSYNGGQAVTGGTPSFSETLVNMGATYQLTEPLRIYANYSESFSMPDVGRVLRGIDIPGQSVEQFLDLKPILTENYEIGLELNLDSLRGQITYFTSESDLGQRLQPDADGIFSVQREKTEIDGIELRADWLLGAKDTLGLRYAYLRGEFDSDQDGKTDTDLSGVNISPNRLNLSWEHNWAATVSTRLQANYLFDRKFTDASGATYEAFNGYTTFDLYANWMTPVGNFSLGINNLADKDYFSYHSQAGGGSNSRNFKGLGRSAQLSYDIQF